MSESDFAMEYAEERKMRINLERRLYALIFEIVPFQIVTIELIKNIINAEEAEDAAEKIMKLTAWNGDLDVQILINLLKPAGTAKIVTEDEIRAAEGVDKWMTDVVMERAREMAEDAAYEVREEWDKWAAEFHLVRHEDLRISHCVEIEALVRKRKGDKVADSITNRLKTPPPFH